MQKPRSGGFGIGVRGRSLYVRARWSSTSRQFMALARALIYFVDRYNEFSIYDIDFRAIPSVETRPAAIGDLHFFGIVQYIGADRTADWVWFYSQLFGFTPLPDRVRFGIMPKGLLLQSPCRSFFLQLIEPDDNARYAAIARTLAAYRLRDTGCNGNGSVAGEARHRISCFGEGSRERPRGAHKALSRERHVRARA